MNSSWLEKVLTELQDEVSGARVAKIHQPTADTLVLRLWNGRENLRLLLSCGQLARLHLTDKDYPNPFTPPRFCQLLRARLRRVVSLSQVGNDRIVRIDGAGPEGCVTLYVELFSAPGNLILVDGDGRIIDALLRRPEAGARCIQPGKSYLLPPPIQKAAVPLEQPLPLPTTSERQSVSQRLDDHYYPQQFDSGQLGDRGLLQKLLQRQQKRLQRRLVHIAGEGEQKESHQQRRHQGELLLANLHLVRRGMTQVKLTDYGNDPPTDIEIALDPALSPQENAEKLFRRYKKEKRGLDHIERRTQETEAELVWIEQNLLALEEAQSAAELNEIAAELQQAGLYRPRKPEPASRRKLPSAPTLNRQLSPNGFVILWGKNNRGNDYLTTRVAAPHDLWFHAQGVAGCHLVLKRDSPQIEIPEADLQQAAAIAAGYSRARHERAVEVAWCLARDVYKVKGAHPGQVNLRTFEIIRVAPLRLTDNR